MIQCRPGDPEAKGLVERANGYLETSFLPGRAFTGPADFNAQLSDWLIRANPATTAALGCRPSDRWEADRAAMLGAAAGRPGHRAGGLRPGCPATTTSGSTPTTTRCIPR